MEIRTFRTPGLGDSTYLLVHNGIGLLVDPQRDVERFLESSQEEGVRIRYVLETHVHNDYVSGGRAAAARDGAELVIPAAAGVAFDHTPAFHLEELEGENGLTIRPIHTPGHTPEHMSYLVLLEGKPVALFSGGSLLVGSAGRTDLLGQPRARQLAVLQYGSLQRLISLPDEVGLYPTHGEGSFCTASGAGQTTSTIGQEKRQNPVLRHSDARAFVEDQLSGLQPYPKYYAHMGPINLLGPTPLPERPVPELAPAQIMALGAAVQVVDARPRGDLAGGYIPGALGMELGEQFGVWMGWLLPFDAPIVLVLNPGQDLDEAVVQLARIGFERVVGVLRGMEAWKAEGYPVETLESIDLDRFTAALERGEARQMLDVRAPAEWQQGHVPGSTHRYVPDLLNGPPDDLNRDEQVWVACGSGYRASIAATLLQRHGLRAVMLGQGGVPDLLQRLQGAPGR